MKPPDQRLRFVMSVQAYDAEGQLCSHIYKGRTKSYRDYWEEGGDYFGVPRQALDQYFSGQDKYRVRVQLLKPGTGGWYE